jgi:hypothetical protein
LDRKKKKTKKPSRKNDWIDERVIHCPLSSVSGAHTEISTHASMISYIFN